jgi:hypothetical protein
MTSAFRLAALVLSVSFAPTIESTTQIVVERAARADLELVDLSAAQTAMISHAIDLFATAGLDLPPLVVVAGERGVDCGGHGGLHHPHHGWSEIELCATAETAPVMHTVLHELAHAWAYAELDPARRDAFMAMRGVEVWRDYDVAAWEDNGTEQAAEIISWGINDVAVATVRIDDTSCADLRAGYETLTGTAPSYGLTDICAGGVEISHS